MALFLVVSAFIANTFKIPFLFYFKILVISLISFAFKKQTKNSSIWIQTPNRFSCVVVFKGKSWPANLFRFVCAKLLQSCLTLCDPIDHSLPGSSVHGILQGRILEWVAISPQGHIPDPGIKPISPASPALAGRFFTTSSTWLCERKWVILSYLHKLVWKNKLIEAWLDGCCV